MHPARLATLQLLADQLNDRAHRSGRCDDATSRLLCAHATSVAAILDTLRAGLADLQALAREAEALLIEASLEPDIEEQAAA